MKEHEETLCYKATEPITSLPGLLEKLAQKISDLERRVALLEKVQQATQQ